MNNELPILETPRLLLREVESKDAEDMFEYATSPLVGPVAGWEPHRHINDTRAIIQMFKDKKKYGQLGVYAIILKSENKMIGTVELHTYIRNFKAELGYTVNPRYWGKGIAVEASFAVLRWGFIGLNLKRIECTTFVENYQSKRVCEKLGFTYEGIRKKGYLLYDGTLHDIYAFAMTDDEFYALYEY